MADEQWLIGVEPLDTPPDPPSSMSLGNVLPFLSPYKVTVVLWASLPASPPIYQRISAKAIEFLRARP